MMSFSPSTQPSAIRSFLAQMCAGGPFRIGQISVTPLEAAIELRHVDESHVPAETLSTADEDVAAAARKIVLYDDAGKYRPLKSAPNLKHGWRLLIAEIAELQLVLDIFYPAAIGTWVAYMKGAVRAVSWRETISRQTGMYRIVGKITDEQSVNLVTNVCNRESGCLRRILWPISSETSHQLQHTQRGELLALCHTSREIPILCIEACNLLVAAGRKVVKGL
jgi:sirohydrochlorin cobaltochelatase